MSAVVIRWFRSSLSIQLLALCFLTLLATQAVTLLPALLITQLFYHWKSFLLEFGGFLVTWFVIDFIVTTALDALRGRRSASS